MYNYTDIDRGDPTPYFEMDARREPTIEVKEPNIAEHLGKALAILEGLMYADDLFLEAEECSDLGKESDAQETLECANRMFTAAMGEARSLVFGFTHGWEGYRAIGEEVSKVYNREYQALDEYTFKEEP